MEPIDVEINVRMLKGRPDWLVEVRSLEPTVVVPVAPLADEDLSAFSDLHRDARSWKGFLRSLSPGATYSPGAAMLRAVGGLVRERLLGSAEIVAHLKSIEHRAERERRPLRFLFEIDEDQPGLALLPLELSHDGNQFVFKQRNRPVFRCSPQSDARNLQLGTGSRALLVTASDGKDPDPARLADHAAAVAEAIRNAGFLPRILAEPSEEDLHQEILQGEGADLLYVICNAMEAPDEAGRLALRGGSLSGLTLAAWLEKVAEEGREVQAVILCASSSASPQAEQGTLGMAQWLVRPGRAVAALGFRGPVGVDWALRWAERIFARLGDHASLEEAFSEARYREADDEPQWVLPVLYGRRRDPGAIRRSQVPASLPAVTLADLPPLTPPLLERPPRSSFTGREANLAKLRDWLAQPGAAQITAVQGPGGIGKTELARVIAWETRESGRLVVWLNRPDLDLAASQASLIQLREPGFQAPEEATPEDFSVILRSSLGPYAGLLVLDDVHEPAAVDALQPGGGWNVLVTSRIEGLLPGVPEIELEPLSEEKAVELLSLVAWESKTPPAADEEDARKLVELLGRLPLALEIAGAALRTGVTAREYLDSLSLGVGGAAKDMESVRATMTRSLRDLGEAAEATLQALAILPPPGASDGSVAVVLGEPAPAVARRLDRLVRHNLVGWSQEAGRYRLHPLVRSAALDRLETKPELQVRFTLGAALALEQLGAWVHEPAGVRTDLARERWARVRDVFDAIDLRFWFEGQPGGVNLAMALRYADDFRRDRTLADRETFLALAEALSREGEPWRRANVLKACGDLRRFRSDLDGAASDYDAALELFKAVEDRLGQANVLLARGDLRRFRNDLDGATRADSRRTAPGSVSKGPSRLLARRS